MKEWIGIDIGGTKLAVVRGNENGEILEKEKALTKEFPDWEEALRYLGDTAAKMMNTRTQAAGISCGSPLDSEKGMILSPPNLPGWDGVPVTDILEKRLGLPVYLQNDADACALAEWKYGAGRGSENMVFCTFGTGMGAGLILNNRLYSGRNNSAGEIGHIRIAPFGPAGYGKEGSFEGFCSGGGMAQMARTLAQAAIQRGEKPLYCESLKELYRIDVKGVAQAAAAGDKTAAEVFSLTGRRLGMGMAVLMDILNPDIIVLGSIFARCEQYLRPAMEKALHRECLTQNLCPVVPALLGEGLGDMAALCVAWNGCIV